MITIDDGDTVAHHHIPGVYIMATAQTDTAPARPNNRLTVFGALLVVASILVAWWLVVAVGDLVTALWMVLFVVTGLLFVSIGRHPSAEQ